MLNVFYYQLKTKINILVESDCKLKIEDSKYIFIIQWMKILIFHR